MYKQLIVGLIITLFYFSSSTAQVPLPPTVPATIPTIDTVIQPIKVAPVVTLKQGNTILKASNDWRFYMALYLLVYFALFKLFFPKYVDDMFALLYRSTIKSKHIKEQLDGNIIPSLLLNVFFAFVVGLYTYIALQYYATTPVTNKYKLLAICILLIGIIYCIKYLGLSILGWLFKVKAATSSYSFTVFYFNKVLGIVLLPFVLYLLLSPIVNGTIITIAGIFIVLLIAYRYVLAYISLQKTVQMNVLHFFLYLCAVELMPLLLLSKAIMVNYNKIL